MKKEVLNHANALVLQVLYRGLRVLYRNDSRVRKEIDGWNPGLTLEQPHTEGSTGEEA